MKNDTSMANRMCNRMVTLASAALLMGGMAVAQTGVAPSPSQQPNGASGSSASATRMDQMNTQNSTMPTGAIQDKTFAKKALAGGLAEVQLGQLAQQKSNSDDVKKFGQQMVDDHTKLNEQMKPIAASLGVQPPAQLTPKDQKLMAKLQALSGDDFDKAYIKAMLKDHKEDDKEFQMEASNGQNPQEKDAATQGDQIIKQHLQMVEDLAKAHNIMVGGSKAM